jgi:putative transposase
MRRIRRKLKRIDELGDVRYLTCSCYQRLPLLNNDQIRSLFADELNRVQASVGFELYAWVVMPEHFHLLVLPADGQVTTLLRRLKAPLARRVIGRWREIGAPILRRIEDNRGRAKFWQAGGGYDRNINSDHELYQKIDYIHANPVRRGLVPSPLDWAWSSARAHAGLPYDGPRICHPEWAGQS